jgi:hypothetical protein
VLRRKRAAVVKAATGDDVIVGEAELKHAITSSFPEDSAMKKPRIVFRHFSGSGPLSIYWHEGPYGDAIEVTKGCGVAWLAPNG